MEAVSQGKVTGVIIPPPDIRAVVDKTAQFVAKNGKLFEEKIMNSAEGQTSKFNFMKIYDPYHAYYEMKIREYEEGTVTTTATVAATGYTFTQYNHSFNTLLTYTGNNSTASATTASVPTNKPENNVTKQVATSAKASITTPIARFALNKTLDTPDPLEFLLSHPNGITPLDVDVIKLSAQYCAINGREFLAALASKEIRNPAFDFLKPTHILFTYFTNLVECYNKLLNPSVNLRDKIKKYASNKMNVLESAVHRYEWNREIEQKKKEDGNSNELQDKTVDWSDFVVVDTIEFGEDELLAPLADDMHGLDLVTDETKVTVERNNSNLLPPPPPPPPVPVLPSRGQSKLQKLQQSVEDDDTDIKIVHDYAPRVHTDVLSTANLTMIDPLSGREVPINEVSEHMRIQLLDPKWREEQARFLEKQKDTGYAEGSSIADNLRQFAKKRSDIFGDSSANASVEKRSKNDTDASISQQNINQKPAPAYNFPPPVIPPPIAFPAANFTPSLPVLPPQPIIAGVTPIVAPAAVTMAMHPPIIPTIMQSVPPAQPVNTAPVHVETAAEFAARFPSPIQLKIRVPFDPNYSSWKFNGQIISIEILVTSSVKSLKELISSHLNIPASKQQLKDVRHGFLKDASTFAELRIGNNHTELELSVRSRGR